MGDTVVAREVSGEVVAMVGALGGVNLDVLDAAGGGERRWVARSS